MPKLIDLENRKAEIAKATWKIMLEKGVAGASVRNIAEEAGLSLGSLRHCFHSQEELMAYVKGLASERIMQKVDRIFSGDQPPKEKILLVLLALLPSTGELEHETRVRIVFKTGVFEEKGKDDVYLAVKNALSNLRLLNLMKKDLDTTIETERLYALINGLGLESLRQPNTQAKAKEIISYHLSSLCKEEEI
ncbi:TetR/AcrR family transcriptional regulator [Planomicrobium sp. CPCC 101110]|uniref:TetR/AcrR family transcriptional regulator n=1 Tax=Planomicrobium sp. CPCC 101110 TaxID=2599619 RepID=UPI0011B3D816|nr:TetR/AcrR family transcriptional regulator [Planomicrobium sp. CPCC 101110]TWT25869.1 TetR family transcriptional regulator [Planomicrobium sp. CPCC 101110]